MKLICTVKLSWKFETGDFLFASVEQKYFVSKLVHGLVVPCVAVDRREAGYIGRKRNLKLYAYLRACRDRKETRFKR